MRLATTLITLAALALPAGAAAQTPDPCAGLANCVVAPEQPVVVIVDGSTYPNDPRSGTSVFTGGSLPQRSVWYVPNPTSYTVTCPAGRVAARASAVSSPGKILGMTVDRRGLPTVNGNNSAFIPTITATSIVPTIGLAPGGTAPAQGTADMLTPSVRFTTSITVDLLAGLWQKDAELPSTSKTASLQWAWLYGYLATFTPSVACVPDTAAVRTRAAGVPHLVAHPHHRHHHRETHVRGGAQRHWTSCPAGYRRAGPVSHAFVVENRTTLSRREIRALRAELGPRRNHIVTRIGKHAPKGTKLQIHATCVPR